ncbi:MAG TPA: GntR family transcriptional regulator, partial [Flexilinea sp.]|nr:GntR family transcriptional regulator [Flexilinea sp.]
MNKFSTQVNTQTVQRLLIEINEGEYRMLDRLPPEIRLAEHFGVSRSTMRDALATLEREGFINRIHGIGTLINRQVLEVQTRIDLEEEFLDIIRNAGYRPGTVYSKVEYSTANSMEIKKLCLEKGSQMIRVTRLISADEVPTIFCIDSFSSSLIRNMNYEESELHKPIFDFLKTYCEEDVFFDLTEIHAVNADKLLAAELQVSKGTALLHLDE